MRNSNYDTLGRVDVCINGTWGKICASNFDINDAKVVCAQLGYTPYGEIYGIIGLYISNNTIGSQYISQHSYFSYLPVNIQYLNCNGSETSIFDCHQNNNIQYCSYRYSYAAAVVCQSKLNES